MATYRVELEDGRVFRVNTEGNTPPTEEDLMAYIENNPQSLAQTEEQFDEVKPISMDDIDTSWTSVAKEGLKGFAQGIEYGINKLASGATLGATDWIRKKLGQDVKGQYKAVEDIASPISTVGTGIEIAGSFPTGEAFLGTALKGVNSLEKAATVKDAPKYLKNLATLARAGYLPATGFAEGAAIGGFGTDSLEGALAGGTFGAGAAGLLGIIGAGGRKVFSASDAAGLGKTSSANNATPELKRTVTEAVKDPDTFGVLNTSAGSNKVVAEGVLGKIPDTKRALNKEAIDNIDNVYGKGNYEEGVNQARAAFKANINENSGLQLFDMDDNVKYIAPSALKQVKKQGAIPKSPQTQKNAPKTKYLADALGFEQGQLSYTQEQWLKRLWDSARESATSRASGRQGDYGHVQRVIQDLNGLIKKSRKPDAIFPDGTPQVNTAELIDLRNKFMNLPNMIKNPASAQYATAMRLQDAYEYGLQHTPKSIKQYDLKTLDEELAFYRGVLDRAKNNPETANIAKEVMKQADVLVDAKVPRAEELLSNLEKTSKYYENAEALGSKAYNKVWGSSGSKNISLPTSSTKMILDTAQDILTGRKYRKLGKYILDPTKEIAPLNTTPYYNFGQQTINALINALSKEGE